MNFSFKKFRKFINLPFPNEVRIIESDCVKIREIGIKESNKNWDDEHELKARYDSTCPKCKEVNAVDKIIPKTRTVVDGFYPFLGIKNSHIESYNDYINQCNNCGHEWKKYEMKIKGAGSNYFLANKINMLSSYFNSEYGLFSSVFDELKEFHAESIWVIVEEVSDHIYESTRKHITLKLLRTKFKSIYQ